MRFLTLAGVGCSPRAPPPASAAAPSVVACCAWAAVAEVRIAAAEARKRKCFTRAAPRWRSSAAAKGNDILSQAEHRMKRRALSTDGGGLAGPIPADCRTAIPFEGSLRYVGLSERSLALPRTHQFRAGVRNRHRAQHRVRAHRGRLRFLRQLDGPPFGRRSQFVRRPWLGGRLGRRHDGESRIVATVHLWPQEGIDPRGADQRFIPACRRRRDRRGSGPPALPSLRHRGRDRDDRGRASASLSTASRRSCSHEAGITTSTSGALILHMAADAAVSAAVVGAGLLILWTGRSGSTR